MNYYTLEQCKKNKEIRELKIKSLKHAIQQSEKIIAESEMGQQTLSFLKRKVAQARQDLEILYILNAHTDEGG